MILRRRGLALGAACLAVGPARAWSQRAPAFDPSHYRQTFGTDFSDPSRPLWAGQGGPFTTRYEEWGGLRTLPANGEQQLYVDPRFVPAPDGTDKQGHADAPAGSAAPLGYDPFAVRDGCLEISAIPVTPAMRARGVDRAYLSGLISTEWSFTQRFGYFEIRTQLPPGRGLWPAFWMVSKTQAEHIEIDVMEAIGQQDRVYHSVHMSKSPQPLLHVASARRPGFDSGAGMHSYGVLWTDDALQFLIDGVESARVDAAPLRNAPPMYLLANLAVGGAWPGSPPPSTPFPAVMRIQSIRAYQRI